MAKKKTIKNVSPNLESNLVAERIDDTYETKLRSTTTFNKHAIVETEVTMKKPDDLAANYEADVAKVYVNGVEINNGDDPTGTIEITENGTYDVKTYANADVNVTSYPEPTGTITITENGTVDVKDYAEASVNVEGYTETLLWENPNPTVAFPQTDIQEITKSIANNYDALKFILKNDATGFVDRQYMKFNDSTHIVYPFPLANKYYGRNTLQAESYLRIYDCTDGGSATSNATCIPIKIYGVKF